MKIFKRINEWQGNRAPASVRDFSRTRMGSSFARPERTHQFVVILMLIYSPLSWAAFGKSQAKTAQSGPYRIFYVPGDSEKRPELGKGKFRELNYKIVFQDEWKPSPDRLVQIAFVDPQGFIVARDVLADKDLAPRGEYYGSVWVPQGRWKNIRGVKVNEVRKQEPRPAPKEVAAAPIPEPKPEPVPNPGPKGVFGKKVITDEDILKALGKKPDKKDAPVENPAGAPAAAVEDPTVPSVS